MLRFIFLAASLVSLAAAADSDNTCVNHGYTKTVYICNNFARRCTGSDCEAKINQCRNFKFSCFVTALEERQPNGQGIWGMCCDGDNANGSSEFITAHTSTCSYHPVKSANMSKPIFHCNEGDKNFDFPTRF